MTKRRASLQKIDIVIVLALFVVSAAIMSYGLGRGSLQDWDEAIYAQVSREILVTKQWLSLQWGYMPWFHKPPLFMWLTSSLFAIGGVSECTARAVSAGSAVAVVIVTYILGTKLGGRTQGMLSALVLLTTQHFVGAGRFGTTDVLLTLWIYLTLIYLVRVQEGHQNGWYGAGLAIGLAIMTKGAAGLVVVPVVLSLLFLDPPLRQSLRNKEIWIGIGLCLLVIVPWHIYMTAKFGMDFWDEYMGYHVMARATQAIEDHQGSSYYYLDVMRNYFFPWFFLVPGSAVLLLAKEKVFHPEGRRFLSILVLPTVVFVLYSLAKTKLGWYILPAYPALALCVGWCLKQVWAEKDGFARIALYSSLIAIIPVMPIKLLGLLTVFGALLSVAMRDKKELRSDYIAILVIGILFLLGSVKAFRQVFKYDKATTVTISRVAFREGNTRGYPLYIAGPLTVPHIQFYSNRPVIRIDNTPDLLRAKQGIEVLLSEDTYQSEPIFRELSISQSQGGYYFLKQN